MTGLLGHKQLNILTGKVGAKCLIITSKKSKRRKQQSYICNDLQKYKSVNNEIYVHHLKDLSNKVYQYPVTSSPTASNICYLKVKEIWQKQTNE